MYKKLIEAALEAREHAYVPYSVDATLKMLPMVLPTVQSVLRYSMQYPMGIRKLKPLLWLGISRILHIHVESADK